MNTYEETEGLFFGCGLYYSQQRNVCALIGEREGAGIPVLSLRAVLLRGRARREKGGDAEAGSKAEGRADGYAATRGTGGKRGPGEEEKAAETLLPYPAGCAAHQGADSIYLL